MSNQFTEESNRVIIYDRYPALNLSKAFNETQIIVETNENAVVYTAVNFNSSLELNIRWYLFYEIKRSKLFTAVANFQLIISLLFIGMVILSVAIGWYLSRRIVLPIKVKELCGAIVKGDFSQRVVVANNDEVGELCSSVNYFVDRAFRSFMDRVFLQLK